MNRTSRTKAFTIVELVVIIAVIGILAALTVFGWRNWQQSVARSAVKSDVKQAALAMENARNFGTSGYPLSIPTTYKSGPNVTVTYVSGDASEFCIQGISTADTSIAFHVNTSVSKEPQTGICSGSGLGAPSITLASLSSSTASISWSAVAGASTYEVQKKLSTTSSWDTSVSKTTTSHSYTGLQLGATYNFRVRAVGASGDSGWSAAVNRITQPTPSSLDVTNLVCGNDGGTVSWKNGTLTWTSAPNSITASYQVTSALNQPGTTFTVTNTTSDDTPISQSASSTGWSPNSEGSGNFTVRGVGPNGELSTPSVWTAGPYEPYEC